MQTHSVDKIQFTYTKSQRKTASLFVERDGCVHLIVPQYLDPKQIEMLIQEKKAWIFKSMAEWEDLNASRIDREYVSGEGFYYLGRTYRLSITENASDQLTLKDGYFTLSKEQLKNATKFFKNFYKEKGLQKITERVAYYKDKMGVSVKDIKVMELKNRWASCSSSGNINFHWKCIMAPLTIVDYIIVHELAHLIHKNHIEAFWNEIDKVIPDYRNRIEWLRQNGAMLDIGQT